MCRSDFDIRVPPTIDFDGLEAKIRGWCAAAGPGVDVQFIKAFDYNLFGYKGQLILVK